MGATSYGEREYRGTSIRSVEPSLPGRLENLALAFQETLVAVVRLRSGRQMVADAEVFRAHIRTALKAAEAEAIQKGYSPDDAHLATFAVVAFLDESILNSANPTFADWSRRPLQEELFGTHMAGEVFFENLEKLLARKNSPDLADLLEVYDLCLLLGYRGRYSLGAQEALRPIMDSVAEKIRRIRGALRRLSPSSALAGERVEQDGSDPWMRHFLFGAMGCLLLALLLFVGFKILLGTGASKLRAIASQSQVP